MSETSIAWTHYSFNAWWGCVRYSPGCENCYAEAFAHRLGLELWGPTAPRRFFGDHHWNEPLRWARRREKGDPRHLVFCASMSDLFESCPDQSHTDPLRCMCAARARLWKLLEATPALTWQLLTKRPENVASMVPSAWMVCGFPANVWMLVTAEDQERAALRIPKLLELPARVHGVSYEPALGPVDFRPWLHDSHCVQGNGDGIYGPTWTCICSEPREVALDWIIVGGESGHGARPFDVAWARATVEQCKAAGVAAFVKQLGSRWAKARNTGRDPNMQELHDSKGGDPSSWPKEFRVQEFPA